MKRDPMYSMLIISMLIALSIFTMIGPGAAMDLQVEDDNDDAGVDFAGGTGSAANPYKISNVNELQSMRNTLGKHHILINDINASITSTWNTGQGFYPIGTNSFRFTGSLDGKGYNITKLHITRSWNDYMGLFGYIYVQGSVKNINFKGISVSGDIYVGGVAGYCLGTIKNCKVSGRVIGATEYCGGIVGFSSGTVSFCTVTATVSGKNAVGGVAGLSNGPMDNCLRIGNTTGSWKVGNMVGQNYDTLDLSTSSGYSKGGSNIGGFAGENRGTIKNCYSAGRVTCSSDINTKAGGFVGWNKATIINCYSTCFVKVKTVTNPVNMGFASSVGSSATMRGNFWDNQTSGQTTTMGNATGKSTNDMMKMSTFTWAAWDIIRPRDLDGEKWYLDFTYDYPRINWEKFIDTHSPVAEAGDSQVVNLASNVSFNGAGSTDNMNMVRYEWKFQDNGPVILMGKYPKYFFEEEGDYTVTLTVTDDSGNKGSDITMIYVRDLEKPVADAGPNQTIDMHTRAIIDASGSTDNVGVKTYTWKVHVQTIVTLKGRTRLHLFDEAGEYLVELNISDHSANWNTDNMTIVVNDTERPLAKAGPDVVIGMTGNVTFNGSTSTDNVGVEAYVWTFDDDGAVVLDGVSHTYDFDRNGTFVVTLNVTDLAGNWDTDTMTVFSEDRIDPVAYAGEDLVVDMGSTVTFNGSDSFDNVGIFEYIWTFDDLPVKLYGPTPIYQFNNSGEFVIKLKVTDDAGNLDVDTFNVTVLDTMPPVAHAGEDLIIDMGERVFLHGMGSTDNVGIASYRWSYFDEIFFIIDGINTFITFENAGVFSVRLEVTDLSGNLDVDIVNVTVNDTEAPGANAGDDLVVDMGDMVELKSGGSNDNVAIFNLTWSLNDGVSGIVRFGELSHHIFWVPGIFVVYLNVTDEAGNWDVDLINITVQDNIPPVADAGGTRYVAIGSDVILDGSSSIDNHAISSYTWKFTYDGEEMTFHEEYVTFTFDKEGEYEIDLVVFDLEGNSNTDRIVIAVVIEGTVSGTLFSEDGKPVVGAIVKIIKDDGIEYTTITDDNGNFSLKIPRGTFTWDITKKGYKPISGSSSVSALEESELDLSSPLIVEEGETWNGAGVGVVILVVSVLLIILIAIGALLFLRSRKKNTEEPAVTQSELNDAGEISAGNIENEL